MATPISTKSLRDSLRSIAGLYPEEMVAGQIADIDRIAFNIETALGGRQPDGLTICDLGGGIGLFSPGCAALGMKSILVDDFADPVNKLHVPESLRPHRELGVVSISRDIIAEGLPQLGPIDILTSFDSLEHWHHSPKRVLHQAVSMMSPEGRIVIGVPNSNNARKRISTLLGRNKWSGMEEWYESDIFRGHVREPDVADLIHIGKDLGLRDIHIVGRNWQGRHSANPLVRNVARLSDNLLRLRPTLCSDIYLVGRV